MDLTRGKFRAHGRRRDRRARGRKMWEMDLPGRRWRRGRFSFFIAAGTKRSWIAWRRRGARQFGRWDIQRRTGIVLDLIRGRGLFRQLLMGGYLLTARMG